MSPELLAAVFAGLVPLLGAYTAYIAKRGEVTAKRQKYDREQIKELQEQVLVLERENFRLRRALARAEIPVEEETDAPAHGRHRQ